MAKFYTCPNHKTVQASWCTQCVEAFESRRPAQEMTNAEKLAELEWWGTILTMPFSNIQQRYEELLGRPIFTHEFAYRDSLLAEVGRA